jgi:hypothetical protein
LSRFAMGENCFEAAAFPAQRSFADFTAYLSAFFRMPDTCRDNREMAPKLEMDVFKVST